MGVLTLQNKEKLAKESKDLDALHDQSRTYKTGVGVSVGNKVPQDQRNQSLTIIFGFRPGTHTNHEDPTTMKIRRSRLYFFYTYIIVFYYVYRYG